MATIAIDARIINSTTGRYIERLLHYLEEIDETNSYLVLVRKKDLDYYKPVNKNFRVVEADFADYSFSEQFGFLKLLNSLKPDLVHFCMPQQPVLYRGKHVTTVHDLTLLKSYASDKNWFVYKSKQLVGWFVFKWIARSSAHIITDTEFTRNEYAKFAHVSKKKVSAIYLAADKSTATPLPYVDLQNQQFIMHVGNQNDYKNIRRLVRAHKLLRQKYPSLLLVLVGRLGGRAGSSLRHNKKWIEEHGYEGVVWTDFVDDPQLEWLYENTAAYVIPSLMEGFGFPGLEAMVNGAPVVSSNATVLPEVYGKAAEYFDPTSVPAIAKAIERVISNRERHDELIRLGHEQAAKYSWKQTAEQTLEIYESSLKG